MGEISITATDGANADHVVSDTGDSVTGAGSTGDSGSASTTKTETTPDGSTVTQKDWKAKPENRGVAKVKVKVSRTCPDESPNAVSIELSGTSVSGRVDGSCVFATAVNVTVDPASGVVTTVTTNKRACCKAGGTGGTGMAPQSQPQEFAALPAILHLDRETIHSVSLIKRLFD